MESNVGIKELVKIKEKDRKCICFRNKIEDGDVRKNGRVGINRHVGKSEK